MVPRQLFLTKGIGCHKDQLTSFELALRDAKIEPFNLVTVSSIFPPNCQIVSIGEGLAQLHHGEIVYCVMSRNQTTEPNRLISTAIGIAIPPDSSAHGYLSEYHASDETDVTTGAYAEMIATNMLATTKGIKFDANATWPEQKAAYQKSGYIFSTKHICLSATGDKNGLWTTVIAAAVFIP